MKLKSGIVCALGALLLSFSSMPNGSLTDIAKPYLGEYECKIATLGNKDYLDEFRSLVLELKSEGEYELRYHLKNGYKGKETGAYSYDKDTGILRLSSDGKEDWKRDIPLKNGKILVTVPIGIEILHLQFEQK